MKKKLLTSILAGIFINVFSQVGINTNLPNATLDIHSKGIDASTKALKITNSENPSKELVTILDNGNLGINNVSPQTKLAITATTAGTAFNLSDSSQGAGMVLTSDANGNARWTPPGFSQFNTIAGKQYSQDFTLSPTVLKDQNGQPVYIEVNDFGTYNFSIGFYIMVTNLPVGNSIRYIIVQLLPDDGTSNPSAWNSNNRFAGSYEAYGVQGEVPNNRRIYYNQNLTVTASTGKRLYVWVALASDSINPLLTLNASVSFGQNSITGCPQCTGGSYIRIN